MTVGIVGAGVAVRCPSETIAQSARELHCATSGSDTDPVRATVRQRAVGRCRRSAPGAPGCCAAANANAGGMSRRKRANARISPSWGRPAGHEATVSDPGRSDPCTGPRRRHCDGAPPGGRTIKAIPVLNPRCPRGWLAERTGLERQQAVCDLPSFRRRVLERAEPASAKRRVLLLILRPSGSPSAADSQAAEIVQLRSLIAQDFGRLHRGAGAV
jgi:hypothetical protein